MKHQWLRTRTAITLAFASVVLLVSTAHTAPPSITTQMYNNQHTGWNNQETQLNIANVKTNFKLLFKDKTVGQTYSQPLYIPALNLGRLGTHNVIFVATENNLVYAFDADRARGPLWTAKLTPVGETLQVTADYDNFRIPQMGVTGTPVIDATTGTLYAVAASKTTAASPVYHQRLHALDITTGKERANSPVDIVASFPGTGGTTDGDGHEVFSPVVQFNRSALTLFQNNIYTAWSAHEDNGNYQGWVIAYDKTSLQQTAVFDDSPNIPPAANGNGGGSIWQASIGMVADDASIYAVTSNGPFDINTGGADWGDSALRLGPTLNVADSFTPCNQQELGDFDVDLGSGGPMILPDQTSGPTKLLTFAGKEGSIYLIDRTAMGGYTPTTVCTPGTPCNTQCSNNVINELWRIIGATPVTSSDGANRDAYWGAPAYFKDSNGRQYVYYTGDYSPVAEFDLANGTLTPGLNGSSKPNQTPGSTYNFAHGGTIPVISSDSNGDGTSAILWAIRRALPPSDGAGPITLDAYSATDLTQQIVYDIPAGSWPYHNDAFLIPTVANGKVYVFSAGELDVFGVSSTTPGGTGAIRIGRRLNFGKVTVNSTRTRTFTIHNAGTGDLHVSLAAQDPFLVPGTRNVNLARGQTSPPISVEFSPTAAGPVSQPLTINCDDPKNPTPSFTLEGTGK